MVQNHKLILYSRLLHIEKKNTTFRGSKSVSTKRSLKARNKKKYLFKIQILYIQYIYSILDPLKKLSHFQL